MVDCTSAPATTPLFDAENQDLPLHEEEDVNVAEKLFVNKRVTGLVQV